MDTIKTYLENMFMNLPQTAEINRAKAELLNMMEDKYNELKADGKTENEAIGIVISEFGNLNELAEELGIRDYVYSGQNQQQYGNQQYNGQQYGNQQYNGQQYGNQQYQSQNMKTLSLEGVKEYISAIKNSSIRIAVGVFLCICSPIAVILLSGLTENNANVNEDFMAGIGVIVLLCMIACAVGIFIINGISLAKYENLKKEPFRMDTDAERYVSDLRENSRQSFAVKITVGVILCIFSVIPVILVGTLRGDDEALAIWSVALLLLVIAIAVFFFITAGMEQESFKVLLQEEEYNRNIKENKVMDAISSVYWSIITCVYLGYSFITFNWGRSWIIWPVAGVLFGAIATIVSICTKKD